MLAVKVQFGVLEDARRVVLDSLNECPSLDARSRARLASVLVAALRDAGLLAQSVEQHYSATQVANLLNRSSKHVAQQAKAGAFGPVALDDGGYLIPASGVQQWLDRRILGSNPEGKTA